VNLRNAILLFLFFFCAIVPDVSASRKQIGFEFYGDSLKFNIDSIETIHFDPKNVNEETIIAFYNKANSLHYRPLVNHLLYYKEKNKLDDWFFYQLIRKTAQQLCPKQENFELYTLYKWFLLSKSGYDAQLAICANKLLFYARSDDNIYDIPFYKKDDKQYVCLNYHDYGSKIDFKNLSFFSVNIPVDEANKSFSYRVTKMPDFDTTHYAEKDLQFQYDNKNYTFKVMVNPEVQNIFVNYPVVDYEAYFNIPLSKRTYNSLIPELKNAVKGMNQKKGVDYLMRFAREAFAYQNDQAAFGKEKRLSPEQTLLYNTSDCDDRAALFFALVKEIYNLPMIVLLYPKHVTIAVQFEKSIGKPILYKDKKYYVCEPTPQATDLSVGQQDPKLRNTPYEIAYEYSPTK
jgi:hypothetical protein